MTTSSVEEDTRSGSHCKGILASSHVAFLKDEDANSAIPSASPNVNYSQCNRSSIKGDGRRSVPSERRARRRSDLRLLPAVRQRQVAQAELPARPALGRQEQEMRLDGVRYV